MRIVFALVLFIGVALAGGAVYFAGQQFNANATYIADLKSQISKNVELTKVYAAADDLKYGHVLTKDDIVTIDWPTTAVPETAFTKIEDLIDESENTAFRTIIRAIDKDEIILRTKVTQLGEDAGVASRLSKGMRAFTLRVDVASGVSGFLRPGDKIDIYWTGKVDGSIVTRLIMDGISLIAIDQSANQQTHGATVAKTVTVAVSPRIVAALAQAQSTGKLLLSLRGVNDETNSDNIEVSQNDLLGREDVKAVQKEEKKVCTIKTRKGAEVIQVPIPCSN